MSLPVDWLVRFQYQYLVDSKGCWNFIGCKSKDGYGHVQIKGKIYLTSYISYKLSKGAIPEGLFVLHECDNPPCINPDHLFLGTKQDNMDDMQRKGRNAPHNYKLSPEEKIEIREKFATGQYTQKKLGSDYGVTPQAIFYILRRKDKVR